MAPNYLSSIRGQQLIPLLIVVVFITSFAWSTFDGQPNTAQRVTQANTVDAELLQQIQSTPLHMVTPTMFLSGPETYDLFVSFPQQPQELDIIKISSSLMYQDTPMYFLPLLKDSCEITSYIDSADENNVHSLSFNPPIKPISVVSTYPVQLEVVLSPEVVHQLLQPQPSSVSHMTSFSQDDEMGSEHASFISPLQQRFHYHIGFRCTLPLGSDLVTEEIPPDGDLPGFTHYHSTLNPTPKSFRIQIHTKSNDQLVDEALYITPTSIVTPSIHASLQSVTYDPVTQHYLYKVSIQSSHIGVFIILFPTAPLDIGTNGSDTTFALFGSQLTVGGEMIKTPTTRSRSNDIFQYTHASLTPLNIEAFSNYQMSGERQLLFQPQLDLSQFSPLSHMSLITIFKSNTPLTYTITSPSRLIAPKGLILQYSSGQGSINIDSYYSVIDVTELFNHQQQSSDPSVEVMSQNTLSTTTTPLPALKALQHTAPHATTHLNLDLNRLVGEGPIYRFSLDVYRLYRNRDLYCEMSFHHLVHEPETPLEFSVLNFQPDGNLMDDAHAAFVAGCLVSPQPVNMDDNGADGSSGDGADGDDTHRITTTLFKFYSKGCYEYFYNTQFLKPGSGWAMRFDLELTNNRHGNFLPIIPSLVCIPHDQWPNEHPHDDMNDTINNHPQLHLQTKMTNVVWSANTSYVLGAFLGTLHIHTRSHSYTPHFLFAYEYLQPKSLNLDQNVSQRPGRPGNRLGAAEFLFTFDPYGLQYLSENGSLELHVGIPSAYLTERPCTCGVFSTPINTLYDQGIYDETHGVYNFVRFSSCNLMPMTLQSGEQYSTAYHHHPELLFKLEIPFEYISEGSNGQLMVVCPVDPETSVIPPDSSFVFLKSMIYYRLNSPINKPTVFQVPITGMYLTTDSPSVPYRVIPTGMFTNDLQLMVLSFSHSIAYHDEFSDALTSCVAQLLEQFGDPNLPSLIPTIVKYFDSASIPIYTNPSSIWINTDSYASGSPSIFEELMSTQTLSTPSTMVWFSFFDESYTQSYSVKTIFPHIHQSKSFIPHQVQSCLALSFQQPSPPQQAQEDIHEDRSPMYDAFLHSLVGNSNHIDALRNNSLQPLRTPLTIITWEVGSTYGGQINISCFTQTGCNPACYRHCLSPREYHSRTQGMQVQEQRRLGTTLGSRPSLHLDIDPDDYDTLVSSFRLHTCQASSECSPDAYCGADHKCYTYPHISNQFMPFLQPETYDTRVHCVQRTPVASGAEGEYSYQLTSCELKIDIQCPSCLAITAAQCDVEVIVACYNQSFDMYVPQEYCVMPDALPGLTVQTAARVASTTQSIPQPSARGIVPTNINTNNNTPSDNLNDDENLNDTGTIIGSTFLRYADHDRVFTATVRDLPSCNCDLYPYNGGEHCEIPMYLGGITIAGSTGEVVHPGGGADGAADAITYHYLAKDDTVDITWTFTGRANTPVQVYLMSTTAITTTTPPQQQQQHAVRYMGSTRGDKQSYTIVVPHLQRDVYTKGMTIVLFVGELSTVVDPAGVTLPTAPTSFLYGGDQPIKLFYQPQCFAWSTTTQTSHSVCPGTAECSLTLDRCVGCPAGFLGPLCDQFICETTNNQYAAMSPQCVADHYTKCTVNGVVFTRPVEVDTNAAMTPLSTPSASGSPASLQPTLFSSPSSSSSSDTMTTTPTQVAPNGSTCACTPDWSGAQCASAAVCAGRSSSTSLVCLNNGYRYYDPESDECDAQCTCTHHWSGARCNTCGLTCTSPQRGYPSTDCRTCQCTYGYTGAKCECRFLRGDITFGSYPVKYHRVFTGEAHAAVSAYEKQYVYGSAAANGEQPPPALKAEYLAMLELIAGYNILMDSIHRELTSSIDIPEARQRVTIASVTLSPPRQNGGNGSGNGGSNDTPGNRSLIIVVQIMDNCGKGGDGNGGSDINSIKLAWDNLTRLLRDGERPPLVIHDPEDDTAIDIGKVTDVTDLVDPVEETNGVVYGDAKAYSSLVVMSSMVYIGYVMLSMAITVLFPP